VACPVILSILHQAAAFRIDNLSIRKYAAGLKLPKIQSKAMPVSLSLSVVRYDKMAKPVTMTKRLQFRPICSIIWRVVIVTNPARHELNGFYLSGGFKMGSLGPWELIIILFIVLIIFGPKKLPEMGRSIGRAIREFKNAGKEIQNDIVETIEGEEQKPNKPANKTVQG
jgi:TatA/E family protein of Tat protein translocase